MLLKSPILHSHKANGQLCTFARSCNCASSRQSRVASAAAMSPTLAEPTPKAAPLEGRYEDSGSGIFLSRKDCLEVLNRITDSCLMTSFATSLGASSAAFNIKQETGNGPDLTPMVSRLFDALYDNAENVFMSKRGYIIPRREAALVEATGGSPTYGEMTGEGVTQFLRTVPLQLDDVLVDLGSGLGRLVLQVACSARLRRCVGLELSGSRHEQACWVASQLAKLEDSPLDDEGNGDGEDSTDPRVAASSDDDSGDVGRTFLLQPRGIGAVSPPPPALPAPRGLIGQEPGGLATASSLAAAPAAAADEEEDGQLGGLLLSPVELRCEDLMEADLGDGTAFFLCSTAFSGAACRAIAERLARHPPFRLLVTSRALPFPTPLTLLGQFDCGFTWTAAGTAYVYVRSLREAPAGLLAAFLASSDPADAEGTEHGADSSAEADGSSDGGSSAVSAGAGIAWLPSTSTISMVPGDLMF